PALFLLGVVVAGLVSAAIALRLFREYAQNRAREQAVSELLREADGITKLYSQQAGLKLLSAKRLELAPGDKICDQPQARGLDVFPGQGTAFTPLPRGVLNPQARIPPRGIRLTFRVPNTSDELLAAARPLIVGKKVFGAIVVAKPETVLNQQWLALNERPLIPFAGRVLVAAAFGWSLPRRITTPVLQLTAAADEVAAGHYDVDVPSGGAGEIGELADRFGQMASRLAETEELERNFLMT